MDKAACREQAVATLPSGPPPTLVPHTVLPWAPGCLSCWLLGALPPSHESTSPHWQGHLPPSPPQGQHRAHPDGIREQGWVIHGRVASSGDMSPPRLWVFSVLQGSHVTEATPHPGTAVPRRKENPKCEPESLQAFSARGHAFSNFIFTCFPARGKGSAAVPHASPGCPGVPRNWGLTSPCQKHKPSRDPASLRPTE